MLEDLKVTYIHQSSREVLKEVSFATDDKWMAERAGFILQWWRGKRPANGVEPDDTFKCRICEFEAGCSWRLAKAQDAVQRFRQRQRA